MELIVRKWGNSFGIRLPHKIAESLKLTEGSSLDINLNDDVISIRKIEKNTKLNEMLSKINDRNIHKEISTSYTVGNEL